MSSKPIVDIHCDGACSPNPGVGGWGAILSSNERKRELRGAELTTTNNRMELTAAIRALEALKLPCTVRLYTDSLYVMNAFKKGWLANWQRNGWRTAAKKPVENQDLWQALLAAEEPHAITWELVKGHAGHELNERADILAVQARELAASERQ